jgi:hypothetical protein
LVSPRLLLSEAAFCTHAGEENPKSEGRNPKEGRNPEVDWIKTLFTSATITNIYIYVQNSI